MQLSFVSPSTLIFPVKEMRWLRAPLKVSEIDEDFFVWSAQVTHNGTSALWSWTNTGTSAEFNSKIKAVPSLRIETDGSTLSALCFWMKTAFAHTDATDAEWIQILKTLKEWGIDYHKYSSLALYSKSLAQREPYAFLNDQELSFIHSKNWNAEYLECLEKLSTPIRDSFIQSIQKWNLNEHHAKESSEFIFTVSKKLSEKAALSLLKGQYQSAEEFRTTLFRTAQPELFQLSDQRIHKLRALNAPQRTAIHSDPSFENDSIKITHSPKNMADLELFRNWVNDEDFLEKFRSILEIYNQ